MQQVIFLEVPGWERLHFYLQAENPGTQLGVMMGPRTSWFWKQKYLAPVGYQTSDCPVHNLVSRPSNPGSMRKLIAVFFVRIYAPPSKG